MVERWFGYIRAWFSQLITERTTHIPGMMEFVRLDPPIDTLILIPRRFDKVDNLTGTPEPDVFEVQRRDGRRDELDGQILFNPIITNGVNDGEDGEIDFLVYQEQLELIT